MLDIAAGIALGLVTLAASWLALSYFIGFLEYLGEQLKAARATARTTAQADVGFPAHAEPLLT